MGKVSGYTMARSWANGRATEELFVSIMEARGHEVIKSTKQEDIHLHIDYYVSGHSVDVKGSRKIDKIWLELVNVKGKKGWLDGEADYIAFHFDDVNCFMIFNRRDLLKFVKENVDGTTSQKPPEYMKWYTRSDWDRSDKIVKVKYEHIKHIEHQKIIC